MKTNKAKIFEEKYNDFSPNFFEAIIMKFETPRKKIILNSTNYKNKILVDLACGNGDFFDLVKDKTKYYYGFDISKKRISKAKRRYNKFISKSKFLVKDLDHGIPLDDKMADIIICDASMQYFVRPLELMRESKRVLKNNGLFIIQVSNVSYILQRVRVLFGKLPQTSAFGGIDDGGALHYYNQNKISQMLKMVGFKIIFLTNSGLFAKFRKKFASLLAADIIIKAKK